MLVGILGDVHGQIWWTRFALNTLAEMGIKTVYQVGDFGLWRTNRGHAFLRKVSKTLVDNDQELVVTLGNHESWFWADQEFSDNGNQPWHPASHITILPRGWRWSVEGTSFVSLGGAPSVDRTWRLQEQKNILNPQQHLWFPGEMMSWEDVDRTASQGHADVMLGHDVPSGVPSIERLIAGNPHGFLSSDLLYALDGRNRLTVAVEAVQPDVYIGGHYHTSVMEEETQFSGSACKVSVFDCNEHNHSFGYLDTDTLQVEHIDARPHLLTYRI